MTAPFIQLPTPPVMEETFGMDVFITPWMRQLFADPILVQGDIGGTEGPAGPEGPQGPQGIQGIQGIPGDDGAQGPAGADGADGAQGIQGVPGADGAAGAQGIPGVVSQLRVALALPVGASIIWTNMPAALSFWLATATAGPGIQRLDLTGYTQVRLRVMKLGVAGAAAAKLILRYKASPMTQVVANYSDIGASEVSLAVNVTNTYLETAWINLVAGAKADVFMALLGSGGDGALDPAFGAIVAEFK